MRKVFLSVLFLLMFNTFVFAEEIQYKIEFSPYGKSLSLIIDFIDNAQDTIYIAAYSFTSKPISEALVRAHNRNVQIYVVADEKSNKTKYTAVQFLANKHIKVRVNNRYTILHHKFILIDNKHIQLGSFNYSASAVNKNAENVLILFNVPNIVQTYSHEWLRLWNEGVDIHSNY